MSKLIKKLKNKISSKAKPTVDDSPELKGMDTCMDKCCGESPNTYYNKVFYSDLSYLKNSANIYDLSYRGHCTAVVAAELDQSTETGQIRSIYASGSFTIYKRDKSIMFEVSGSSRSNEPLSDLKEIDNLIEKLVAFRNAFSDTLNISKHGSIQEDDK